MKTPREILLTRHREAGAKLDALRREVVRGLTGNAEARNPKSERNPNAEYRTGEQVQADSRAIYEPQFGLRISDFFRASGTRTWDFGWRKLWRELIQPCRRLWSGLATVWLLLLVINLSQRNHVSSITGQPVHAPAIALNWQAQQHWMNELFADRVAPPDADRPRHPTPRPRTGHLGTFAA